MPILLAAALPVARWTEPSTPLQCGAKESDAWVLFAAQVRWWANPESDHRLTVARGHEVGRECLPPMEGQLPLSPHQSESLFFKAQLKAHSSARPQLLPYILHPCTCVCIVPETAQTRGFSFELLVGSCVFPQRSGCFQERYGERLWERAAYRGRRRFSFYIKLSLRRPQK